MLAVLVASTLEYISRRLFRDTLTFTVGKEMFDTYRKTGKTVYQTAVTLVSEKDVAHTICKQIPHKPSQIRLLSVGRLDPEKGIIYLIQALDELVANGKTDIILDLVGDGSEEKRLRWEVSKRGLAQYVNFLGYVSHSHELFSLYRQSDIFILPSLTEGWPQTLFEAMATRVPIVATRVGGIPYLIEDGENGLLINPASPRAICKAVQRLINASSLRNRLIKNGLSTVRNHTLDVERDRMIGHIEEFLKQDNLGDEERSVKPVTA